MIGAIGSNSSVLDTISSQYGPETTGQASGAARSEKETPQKGGTEEIRAVYGNQDIVTISAEGAAYARQAAAAKASQDGGSSTTAKVADSAVTSAAKIATDMAVKGTTATKVAETETAESEAASSAEGSEETASLSDYTDAELKQMMYKGDITRSEYDEEMLSRNGFTAETETEA